MKRRDHATNGRIGTQIGTSRAADRRARSFNLDIVPPGYRGGAVVPSPATIRLIAQGMAPQSWNRYSRSLLLRQGVCRTPRSRSPCVLSPLCQLPIDVGGASRREPAHTCRQSFEHARSTPSALSPVFPPHADVTEVRTGVRRTRYVRRGQATPVSTHEILVASALPSPPRAGGRPRSWPLSIEKRGREHAVRAHGLRRPPIRLPARLEGAARGRDRLARARRHHHLRVQDGNDPLGPKLASKRRRSSCRSARTRARPLSWKVPACTSRVSPGTHHPVGGHPRRCRRPLPYLPESCSDRAIGRGSEEFGNWPADIQALAAPLYARGDGWV
jgi:hypothetical protein